MVHRVVVAEVLLVAARVGSVLEDAVRAKRVPVLVLLAVGILQWLKRVAAEEVLLVVIRAVSARGGEVSGKEVLACVSTVVGRQEVYPVVAAEGLPVAARVGSMWEDGVITKMIPAFALPVVGK